MTALENIKWLEDVFVTKKEKQHFEVDKLIKDAFSKTISELKKLQTTSCDCDGCSNLPIQRECLKYSCMPDVCRACVRKADDRYTEEQKC